MEEDSDDEDFDLESTCRITGFLRTFVEAGMERFIWRMYCTLYILFVHLMDILIDEYEHTVAKVFIPL